MPKLSSKLLILSLLSVFAAASTSVVVAAEGRHTEKHEEQHAEHHPEQPPVVAPTLKTSVITVTNRGMMPLTITEAPTVTRTSGPGNFSIITPSTGTPCTASLVVAPDRTCTIGVQYTSTSHEMSTARLRLTDSGAETTTQETEIRAN